MTQYKSFLILSICFIIYSIPVFVLPKYINYQPIQLYGIITGYYEDGEPIEGSTKIFDENTIMNDICQTWNADPNISSILFTTKCSKNNPVQNSYLTWYLAAEIILFSIIALFISRIATSFNQITNLMVHICLLLWLISIIFDIVAHLHHSFYQPLYNVIGGMYSTKNFNETTYVYNFADQPTLIKSICDAERYFKYDYHHFVIFDSCNFISSLDEYTISSIVLKTSALILLLISNIIIGITVTSYVFQYDLA